MLLKRINQFLSNEILVFNPMLWEDKISNRRVGRARPNDPLPAFSFAISNSADAIILTCEVCTKVVSVRGWVWLRL